MGCRQCLNVEVLEPQPRYTTIDDYLDITTFWPVQPNMVDKKAKGHRGPDLGAAQLRKLSISTPQIEFVETFVDSNSLT